LDLTMMSLTPLSTASLSRSFIISVCGVAVGMGKKRCGISISPCSLGQDCIVRAMKLRPLTGTITALATPFRRGAVAYDDLTKLVAHQLKGGIDGVVPVGTTGESPT